MVNTVLDTVTTLNEEKNNIERIKSRKKYQERQNDEKKIREEKLRK